MTHEDFTPQHRAVGRVAAWAVFVLGVVYAITTFLGFLSLESPQDPIGDPYFTMMEVLIILIAAAMVVSMVAVHAYASSEATMYSFTALVFMILMASVTSSVHFVTLTVGGQIEATGSSWVSPFISFEWPSVVYALDILAWDWFFALSMLFAAPVFTDGGLEKTVQILFVVSGILSLAGLIGVALADMQVRNVGIVGYAVIGPVAFLFLGFCFTRTRPVSESTEKNRKSHSEI